MNKESVHKYAVFVSGRGSNLKAILDAAATGSLCRKPDLVVTDNGQAKALDYAREQGVDTLFIDPKAHKGRKAFGQKAIEELKKRGIDTIALAGFMRIVHEDVVNEFSGRIVNIHPALLPSFPGLDAQKQAIDAGVNESGCTVHFVDAGVDTGAVIIQAKVTIDDGETAESLSAKIIKHEHRIYPAVINGLLKDRIRLVNGRAEIDG